MNSHAVATLPVASHLRPFVLGCLMVAIAAANAAIARGKSPVEFVVGGLMPSEGGTWSPASSPLKAPFGVDFDSTETLFIVELYGGRVHRLPRGGELETISRNATPRYAGDGGELSQAQFNAMHNGVISARDELLISDSWNHRVRRVDLKTQQVDTVAGTGKSGFQDGPGIESQFAAPKHIACDPSGNVYIADDENRAIRKYDPRTGHVTTILGRGQGDARIKLEHPHGVQWHQGDLYVVDTGNNRILRTKAIAEATPAN